MDRCHQTELRSMHSMLASRSLLRGRDRGRRPAGPRRRRPPCRPRLLFAPLGVLELRRQHLEHHLHVLVSTGLHVFMKLQYAASTACLAGADAGGDGGQRAARGEDDLLPPPGHHRAHGRRYPRGGGQPRRPPRSRSCWVFGILISNRIERAPRSPPD